MYKLFYLGLQYLSGLDLKLILSHVLISNWNTKFRTVRFVKLNKLETKIQTKGIECLSTLSLCVLTTADILNLDNWVNRILKYI